MRLWRKSSLKSWLASLSKEILLSRHDSHIELYKQNLQSRLTQACLNDKTHTARFSQ